LIDYLVARRHIKETMLGLVQDFKREQKRQKKTALAREVMGEMVRAQVGSKTVA